MVLLQQKTTTILLVQVASNIGDHRWWYNVVDDADYDADDDVGGDYYSDDYDDDYKDNSSVE